LYNFWLESEVVGEKVVFEIEIALKVELVVVVVLSPFGRFVFASAI
jgi:hypothetical protein